MMTNNLRDFSNDKAHGRRTLVILLGKDEGIRLLRTLFIVCVLWLFLWVIFRAFAISILARYHSSLPGF